MGKFATKKPNAAPARGSKSKTSAAEPAKAASKPMKKSSAPASTGGTGATRKRTATKKRAKT